MKILFAALLLVSGPAAALNATIFVPTMIDEEKDIRVDYAPYLDLNEDECQAYLKNLMKPTPPGRLVCLRKNVEREVS